MNLEMFHSILGNPACTIGGSTWVTFEACGRGELLMLTGSLEHGAAAAPCLKKRHAVPVAAEQTTGGQNEEARTQLDPRKSEIQITYDYTELNMSRRMCAASLFIF